MYREQHPTLVLRSRPPGVPPAVVHTPLSRWLWPLARAPPQNIVMALHGLMDHIDTGVLDTERDRARASYGRWIEAGRPGLAGLSAGPAATGGAAEAAEAAEDEAVGAAGAAARVREAAGEVFGALDLDRNGRVFMDELALWHRASVDYHGAEAAGSATAEFRQLAAGRAELGWETIWRALGDGTEAAARRLHKPFIDADNDASGGLDEAEFAAFRHPELCAVVRRRYALNFLREHDADGDGRVNATEFMALELRVKGEGDNKYSVQAFEHRAEAAELDFEFHEEFDSNHDGVLEPDEVEVLFRPHHVSHAVNAAYSLGMVADTNGDHELSPAEVAAAAPIFRNSQMLDHYAFVKRGVDAMYSAMASRLKLGGMRRQKDEL